MFVVTYVIALLSIQIEGTLYNDDATGTHQYEPSHDLGGNTRSTIFICVRNKGSVFLYLNLSIEIPHVGSTNLQNGYSTISSKLDPKLGV